VSFVLRAAQLQAGVGGLAAAGCGGTAPCIAIDSVMIVVEPEAAPALIDSIRSGGSDITKFVSRWDNCPPSTLAFMDLARTPMAFRSPIGVKRRQGMAKPSPPPDYHRHHQVRLV
jgi:diaminopropionate ammonia-lyase